MCMSSQSSPLNNLLPEIFPVIASLLPLQATPSTLLSLALVNRHISSIVLPSLYSVLILKNENDALKFLQILLDEPNFGKAVREIHIMSDLSLATRMGENSFNVIKGLEKVIDAGSLPYIHTLGLYLLTGWYFDDSYQSTDGLGELDPSRFYQSIRKNCPRLRSLVIRDGVCDDDGPGFDGSSLLDIPDLANLRLTVRGWGSTTRKEGVLFLKKLETLCNSLHTLDLEPTSSDYESASSLFSLYFPHLRSLSLEFLSIETADASMAFWKRHPTLEYLKIFTGDEETRWFTNEFPSKFLPNLRHLKANFNDVRAVSPILHQLVSLTVFATVNAQVPYLIRFVLPEGLPNLKSLNIGQYPSTNGKKNGNKEGSGWYETEDGKFMEHTKKSKIQSRKVSEGYMHSIARGAPNLEEFGFLSSVDISEFANIASEIAALSKLKRFYYSGSFRSLENLMVQESDALLSSTKVLAEACGELTCVTDTGSVNLPYVTARILRDGEGRIVNVDLGTGYGMHFGNDDQAFPRK